MKRHYEQAEEYTADAYRVAGSDGIAYEVLGWETVETSRADYDNRTGRLIVVMIGDDRHYAVDPDVLVELADGEYCPDCGQIGGEWVWL